jgi:hypothetical protein
MVCGTKSEPNQEMNLERTGAGLEARLRIAGISRFGGATFLIVWLAGWAVGECFACWILGRGAWSLLTGQPPGVGHKQLEFGVALGAGLFLIFWLVLWTIGGLAAGHELLRLLFGRDILLARHDGLEIKHSYGIFCSEERFPREELRRFYRVSDRAPLCVETARGTTVLTRLGTPAERAELEQAFNAEFGLSAQPPAVGALPKGWCEVVSLERDNVLVKDPAVRRKQARVAWIICALLALVPLYLVTQARDRPDLLGAVIFFFALAGAVGWGATWLSFGRNEWRLDKGRLLLQRRFCGNRTPRFEAVSLELVEDNSGENGPSYLLMAVATGAPPGTLGRNAGRFRRTIHSQSDDPTEPRNCGLWLSQRCQIPFVDLTTAVAKAMELETLKVQLANSGRLGRVALRLIERLAPTRPRPRE